MKAVNAGKRLANGTSYNERSTFSLSDIATLAWVGEEPPELCRRKILLRWAWGAL